MQQPEVAGSVSTEVQKSLAAGSEVQYPEVAGSEEKVQQLGVVEDGDFSDSEAQCSVCEPEEQRLHAVLVAEEARLAAYGLQSR